MSRKEDRVRERMWELYQEHEDWCEWKSLAVAVAEEYRRRKLGGKRAFSVRAIGWLEFT